jgi:hypothetical protein
MRATIGLLRRGYELPLSETCIFLEALHDRVQCIKVQPVLIADGYAQYRIPVYALLKYSGFSRLRLREQR